MLEIDLSRISLRNRLIINSYHSSVKDSCDKTQLHNHAKFLNCHILPFVKFTMLEISHFLVSNNIIR